MFSTLPRKKNLHVYILGHDYLLSAFENIVGKEENAGNQHFLVFLQCFLLFQEKKNLHVYILGHDYIVVYKCFEFGLV